MTDSPGPEYDGFRIKTLTTFTQVDPADDQEGLVAFWSAARGGWVPMIAADPVMADEMRVHAQNIANHMGRPIQVSVFSIRKNVETIEPQQPGPDEAIVVLLDGDRP